MYLSAVPLLASGISPNEAITTNPSVQQDPSIAVDPHNASHLVMSYMDYSLVTTGYAGIGVAVSEDGGDTWQTSDIQLPSSFNQGAASPIVHFDDQGRVFVSFSAATFLGTKPGLTDPDFFDSPNPVSERSYGFESNNGIFVAESDDGGSTWNTPVAVVSHLYDGTDPVLFEVSPDLGIDTFAELPDGQANPNYGNLYEVWTRVYTPGTMPGDPGFTGGTDGMIAVSKDHGQTWQIEVNSAGVTAIDDPVRDLSDAPPGLGYIDQVHVSVGPEGDVYVSDYGGGDFSVLHSTDAGQTFAAPDHSTDNYLAFGTGFDSAPLNGFLNTNQFRTNSERDIFADPTRPGVVYAVETISTVDPSGNVVDEAEVNFARSTDYGLTWSSAFTVGENPAQVLNDENGGIKPSGANPNDVIAGQAFAKLSVDAQGDIAVIWYDTRVDPNNHLLNVFGTVSTDGGLSFSPNFRISSVSFDANNGAFTDAAGRTDYYLGDYIGLATANDTGFAAWTDTRNGNQDIYFSQFTMNPAPAALNDRFEPNDTPSAATNLGTVFQTYLPKLDAPAGDSDWYSLKAAATGQLTVTTTQANAGSQLLQLQLWDSTGTTLLATGTAVENESGQVTGEIISTIGTSGTTYLVNVAPIGAGDGYSLQVESLTADLGTQAYGVQSGSLAVGDQDFYKLTTAAAGSLQVQLTPGSGATGSMSLEILNAANQSVLASGQASGGGQSATVAVSQGQAVLLHVFGDSTTSGSFGLTFVNLDQDTVAASSTLIPAGLDPSQSVVADLRGNGIEDIVVADASSDTVSVLLGNGNGTFQAPRQYSVGAFASTARLTNGLLPRFRRAIAVADFNHDGIPDIVVTNYDSGDVSVLLGNGDGTFQPQRRFNAVPNPFDLAVGDLTGNGNQDIVVVSANSTPGLNLLQVSVGVLLGRGDGTFLPPKTFDINLPAGDEFPMSSVQIADVNGDGIPDLIVSGGSDSQIRVFLGNGDGTFSPGPVFSSAQLGTGLLVTDLNGNGIPDIINASYGTGSAFAFSDNGDGTFSPLAGASQFVVGQTPVALAMADLGSSLQNGTSNLGPPDGHPDLIVANSGVKFGLANLGPPDVVVLPSIYNTQGQFTGFGLPDILYTGIAPQDVSVGDFNGDGVADVVVTDQDGIHIIFGAPPTIVPNNTPATARNLGAVVHLVEPTLTIVPGHSNAYFDLTAPTEAASGAGDEVLDFSALFQDLVGTGLTMQLLDSAGNVLASGDRFRAQVQQGQALTLHVFGLEVGNAGAYTLDIDALPQVVSVAAQSLIPGADAEFGGPISSLVINFQGDRLDPTAAQNPANYQVIWFGPEGLPGAGVDLAIPLATGQSAVYDPGTNLDVITGTTYPTAVRQTVTLLFDAPLPAGSYEIELSPNITSAAFNEAEQGILAETGSFGGHPVVSLANGQLVQGARVEETNLVSSTAGVGRFNNLRSGNLFLTQLHSDLGALLDSQLTQAGDQPAITSVLLTQILQRFDPIFSTPGFIVPPLLVIFLDPVSLDLADPSGDHINYNLQSNALSNPVANAFVSVVSNVEVIVMPIVHGQFDLDVADVPATSRGGVAIIGTQLQETISLTDALRGGQRDFQFGLPANFVVPVTIAAADDAPPILLADFGDATEGPPPPEESLIDRFIAETGLGVAASLPTEYAGLPEDTVHEPLYFDELLAADVTANPPAPNQALLGQPAQGPPTTRPSTLDQQTPGQPAAGQSSLPQVAPIQTAPQVPQPANLGQPFHGNRPSTLPSPRPTSRPSGALLPSGQVTPDDREAVNEFEIEPDGPGARRDIQNARKVSALIVAPMRDKPDSNRRSIELALGLLYCTPWLMHGIAGRAEIRRKLKAKSASRRPGSASRGFD
ncbi:MAG: FG-GAP-like repeat-containing protein [Tepidisphaeraceae bacterium]|jgi:hypothetical protein